ncbi:MAG: amidohydrolase family protein, partial [Candidatus Rokubacteria bacterium]|nr:amidohydrolase family protein [Candidatus Rokubacteria bacterium]
MIALGLALILIAGAARPAAAGEYTGPLIDAHSHVSSAAAIDAYVAAMKRHNVAKVVLLGVGGVQKDDAAWLGAAVRKHPDRVVAGLPVADPVSAGAAAALDAELKRTGARVVGEIHLRQVGRRTIERDPTSPAFGRLLEVAARHRVPVVIHYELTDAAATTLDRALAAHRQATIILAHAGEGPPARVESLLGRNP